MEKIPPVTQTDIYNPVPFLMLSDASLAPSIHQQITAPPSPERLPWKMLPELDAKAISYKNRLEQLRQERDRNNAEAARLSSLRGGFGGTASSFSASSNGQGAFGGSNTQGAFGGSINFSSSSGGSLLGGSSQSSSSEEGAGTPQFSFASSSGHRRKTSDSGDAPKKRRSIDTNFIAGNLQRDIFNHDK